MKYQPERKTAKNNPTQKQKQALKYTEKENIIIKETD